MSELKVYFRGLFTLVRHTAPPASGARLPAGAEVMTVVFPKDDDAGGHGHGHGSHSHSPGLYFESNAIRGTNAPPLEPVPASQGGGFKIDIRQSTLFLPVDWERKGVAHVEDEIIKADGSDVSSYRVGPDPLRWNSLSRLANLNQLTGTPFAASLNAVDPNVHASVRLSGGRIRSLRSYKALADCFFEFYTAQKTVAVQPGVEEIEYSIEVGDEVDLGLGPLGATEPSTIFKWDPKVPLILESLPLDGPLPKDLNHFANHYKLMAPPTPLTLACLKEEVLQLPLVRVAARFHDGQLLLTMAGEDGICRRLEKDQGKRVYQGPAYRTTGGPCTCLAAMAFLP
jgi:hypothetical protein